MENSTDKYVDSVQDKNLQEIHDRIVRLKKSREWEERYMKFEELLQKSKCEGIEQGCDWERSRMLKLMNCMIREGETGELSRLEQDLS